MEDDCDPKEEGQFLAVIVTSMEMEVEEPLEGERETPMTDHLRAAMQEKFPDWMTSDPN